MEKVAIFVEGQTEADFVVKYLKEYTCQKCHISIYEGQGGKNMPRFFSLVYQNSVSGNGYMINIYVSRTDNRVNSDINDNLASLNSSGFEMIIGLRDLRGQKTDGSAFTLADLPSMEIASQRLFSLSNPPVKIIIAVMEIETWFLAETNHYQAIDSSLTEMLIKSNSPTTGVNPYEGDLTLVAEPAEKLNAIYQLVGKSYNKKASSRQRTIDALDYVNLYYNVSASLTKLQEFVQTIDSIFV